ncbi:MAG: patatin-like phospholipase domain-containing protein [Acidimicrobiales bacterium]
MSPAPSEQATIGVAVSGGGHRATAWALGTLAALVETGANRQAVSVSSVSGGSIANGVVAKAGDFRAHDRASFIHAIMPLLRVVADEGLFLTGPQTDCYLRRVFLMAEFTVAAALALAAGLTPAAGRSWPVWAYAIVVTIGAVGGGYLGWKLAGLVPHHRILWALADAVITAALMFGAALFVRHGHGWEIVVWSVGNLALVLLCGWLTIRMFSRRGRVVREALEENLLANDATHEPLMLCDVRSEVNHVICATDLESGIQFYFTPAFAYGYREGTSVNAPSRVSLAQAVQASAGFPVGFPPSIIEVDDFVRDNRASPPAVVPSRVILSDGGVYDNMGDEWELGLAARRKHCAPLATAQPTAARVLVVANASPMWEWRDFGNTGVIHREVTALLRVEDVQYNISTSRRRNQLIERWSQNGRVVPGDGGVVVMIDHVPARLVAPFLDLTDAAGASQRQARGADDMATRAAEAMDFLNSQHPAADWADMAARNAKVDTTLGPIGVRAMLDLMEHAYTSTMVGLYVMHAIGRLVPFPRSDYDPPATTRRAATSLRTSNSRLF